MAVFRRLAFGDVHQHVHRADEFPRPVSERPGKRQDIPPRAIGPLDRDRRLPHGGAVADHIADGEAEIGIHQISEILPVAGTTLVGPLPAELQNYIVFSAAIPVRNTAPEPAAAFIQALAAPAAAQTDVTSAIDAVTVYPDGATVTVNGVPMTISTRRGRGNEDPRGMARSLPPIPTGTTGTPALSAR